MLAGSNLADVGDTTERAPTTNEKADEKAQRLAALAARRVKARQRYEDKLARGECTQCPDPSLDDSQYCARHLEKARRWVRESNGRRRARNRARGLCAECAVPCKTYRCLACSVTAGHVPAALVKEREKESRFEVVVDADGHQRTRFVGQPRRGAPSKGTEDRGDLKFIAEYVARATEGQLAVTSAGLTGRDREQAEIAWLDQLDRARRFIDEVHDRHRYEQKRAQVDARKATAKLRAQGAKVRTSAVLAASRPGRPRGGR